MKFRCYEEGCGYRESTISVVADPSPRARAAAEYCAAYDRHSGTRTLNVIVCPADDEAEALPGWEGDEEEATCLCVQVQPQRVITWDAVQVRGFGSGPFGGDAPGGETATVVS